MNFQAYGQSKTATEITKEIELCESLIIKFEAKFKANPNKKTATIFSDEKAKLRFLFEASSYTKEAIDRVNKNIAKRNFEIAIFSNDIKNP
jgi:hypothetical protein